MLFIRLFYRFIALFQSHATHQGLALGICAGMLYGLSPINSIHFWIFVALFFLIKINLASTLLSTAFFSLVSYLGKPAFFIVGDFLFNKKSLIGLWNWLYELPIFPYSNFYVPQVLGKLLVSAILVFPLYLASLKLIKILEPMTYHWWRTTKLYMLYRGYKPYAR